MVTPVSPVAAFELEMPPTALPPAPMPLRTVRGTGCLSAGRWGEVKGSRAKLRLRR